MGAAGRQVEDRELIADAADLADRRGRSIEHLAKRLAAVAVLEDADARAVEVPQRGLCALQHGLGDRRRPR